MLLLSGGRLVRIKIRSDDKKSTFKFVTHSTFTEYRGNSLSKSEGQIQKITTAMQYTEKNACFSRK